MSNETQDEVTIFTFAKLDEFWEPFQRRIAEVPLASEVIKGAVDAVDALSRDKVMVEGVLYLFRGMGCAAIMFDRDRMQHFLDVLELDGLGVQSEVNRSALGIVHIGRSPHQHQLFVDEGALKPLATSSREHLPKDWDWNLVRVRARNLPKSDGTALTGDGITVAVMDAGVGDHDDLRGRVQDGVSFFGTESTVDNTGHGTYCAGLIAGAMTGVAPGATIVSVKIADTTGAFVYHLLAGLCWILRETSGAGKGIDVVSVSFAGTGDTTFIPAFANAAQALATAGTLVVASAGEKDGPVFYPANTPGFVAVGMYRKEGGIAAKSNYGGKGNQIAVVAPSEEVWTTDTTPNQYCCFGGSSGSTPHVAGAIALLKESKPGITPNQVYATLFLTSQLPDDPVEFDLESGAGLINCAKLVTSPLDRPIEPPSDNSSGSPSQGRIGPDGQKAEDDKCKKVDDKLSKSRDAVNHGCISVIVASKEGGSGERYAQVAIVNIDSAKIDSKRLKVGLTKGSVFEEVPFGRYHVVAMMEGQNRVRGESVVVVKSPNTLYPTTIRLKAQGTGKITAFVRVNGVGRSNAHVTIRESPDPLTAPLVPPQLTDYQGKAYFDDDSIVGGKDYYVTANVVGYPPSMPSPVRDNETETIDFFDY